jgi:NAD(P)-dependent dehydrogenase (short-subunit alcohol dehydrogenase family)
MGNTNPNEPQRVPLGSRSTALEVVQLFANGPANGFLNGKVAVITGGNSGIGLETCKALSSAGCRVIMGTRSVDAGQKAIQKEIQKLGIGKYVVKDVSNIAVKELNLESLVSIRKFADEVREESRIDYLVLNAGVMMATANCEYTENDWEKQIGVNHYGHFYLTSLLKDKMASQDHPSRIVVVSSMAHKLGSVDINDVHFKNGRKYSPWGAYGQSKMANILFANSLADELKDTEVQAFSLHPGVIATSLWRNSNIFVKGVVSAFVSDKSIPQGASTTVFACLDPGLEKKAFSGAFLKDCAIAQPNDAAQDTNYTRRVELWKYTEDQINEALAKEEQPPL